MSEVIKGNFPQQKSKAVKKGNEENVGNAYQFTISLLGSDPLIWRLIQVPGKISLAKFHNVIQLCMGWTDSHLHQFMAGEKLYGPADVDDDWGGVKNLDESQFKLNELESDIEQRFMYIYDFGDSWEHKINLEKTIRPDEKSFLNYPVLLEGERACPPEDIGGIPGYEDFLAALKDPKNEDHTEMLDWYGSRTYDPEYFATDEINNILKKMK